MPEPDPGPVEEEALPLLFEEVTALVLLLESVLPVPEERPEAEVFAPAPGKALVPEAEFPVVPVADAPELPVPDEEPELPVPDDEPEPPEAAEGALSPENGLMVGAAASWAALLT